jgi:hypothetical protein
MYYPIAFLKSLFRRLLFWRGAEYKPYSEADHIPGYDGWYERGGRIIAFRRDDNSVQFLW